MTSSLPLAPAAGMGNANVIRCDVKLAVRVSPQSRSEQSFKPDRKVSDVEISLTLWIHTEGTRLGVHFSISISTLIL